MTRRSFGKVAAVAVPSLLLTGCPTALDLLEASVTALEALLPLIAPAAGIPLALVTLVESYASAVSGAITKTADILAGAGTAADKASQIAALFVGIVLPFVPPQYQLLANAVQAVVNYLQKFLASLGVVKTNLRAAHLANGKPSQADELRISAIRARAVAVHNKVQR